MRKLLPGSQCARILDHLRKGRPLTVASAVRLYDSYALSQRVGELKRRGHRIHSAIVKVPSGKRLAVYTMDLPRDRADSGR